jgi:rhodanese-related sulfurtransferase
MIPVIFKNKRDTLVLTFALSAILLLAPRPAWSQGPRPLTRAEKIEAKVRVAYVEATRDIQVPTLKAIELLEEWANHPSQDSLLILIDIRSPAEQKISMIPGAMTPEAFALRFRGGLPDSLQVVAYCTIGYRSGLFTQQLIEKGVKARNLEGGILLWTHAGGPLEIPSSLPGEAGTPTKKVHVYDSEWNLVHPDYEAVW